MMEELRQLSVEDLHSKEQDLRQEIFHLKYQLAMNQLEDTASVKKKRKEIARIKTVLREKSAQSSV
ncbi:50S ribosomal protein L29 [Desulfurispirillum indicum]|uniref:Large ribosomal subunit protein uL29 n=1 Tax=Desulfurispirillum indicum (strain ATCC BAA-1389 / DSM 22839 / S5) TaxID=653733 RepID=E6W718_DESIS|nr:50S ribosomal protein L29 [Desulfurispirillum indicum]ADU65096.1 ribosomal protein L29 [Desulfurispirillum indicum S5]UCZ57001.1 50S ribosomal protein L29 [Desulfurispirillum indicum]